MRISDWSSDVCSSDLAPAADIGKERAVHRQAPVTAGAGRHVERIRAACPQSAIAAGDADEGIDIGAQTKTRDFAGQQGDAHRVADNVDPAGAGTGAGIDQRVLDWRFLAAPVIVAGGAGFTAPPRAETTGSGPCREK